MISSENIINSFNFARRSDYVFSEIVTHEQFKKLCLEYFSQHEKLISNPSQRFATRARKALIRIKKVAHERGLELLTLYAPSLNKGKQPINGCLDKETK